MRQSTKILLKLLRRRALIALAITIGISVILAFDKKPESPITFVFPIVFGVIITMFAMFGEDVLTESMFPVSNRQAAWIPLGIAAAGAVAGILLTTLIEWARLGDTWALLRVLGQGILLWPVTIFFALVLRRIGLLNIGFIGVLPSVLFELAGNPWEMDKRLQALSSPFLLPLWVAGCAFLVLEAPHHLASLMRLEIRSARYRWASSPDLESPSGRHWSTRLADGMTYGAIAAILGGWLYRSLKYLTSLLPPDSHADTTKLLYSLVLPIGLVSCFVAFVLFFWRRNRAAAMPRTAALSTALIETTGWGYGLAEPLGTPSGHPVRCTRCRDWRMPWQEYCPHCHGVEAKSTHLRGSVLDFVRIRHDPLAVAFRVMLPIMLLYWVLMRTWF